MCTASNGIVKWLENEKGTSPRRRGRVRIRRVLYIIRRLYVPGIVTYIKRVSVRERKKISFPHIIHMRRFECDARARVSECAWLVYIYVYIHEYGHMRREFTTFKMYVSDIGHYIRGRRYRRTSVPSRILLKTFYSLSSLSAPGRPTYPSPIIHYPSNSITHTPAPRKSVRKPEYRIHYIVYSTYT